MGSARGDVLVLTSASLAGILGYKPGRRACPLAVAKFLMQTTCKRYLLYYEGAMEAVIYSCEEDQRLWVPKRRLSLGRPGTLPSLGWTLNFAHPESRQILAPLLVVPLGCSILLSRYRSRCDINGVSACTDNSIEGLLILIVARTMTHFVTPRGLHICLQSPSPSPRPDEGN